MPSMGIMRVNGVLGVSRAIGKLILICNFEKYDFVINLIIINNLLLLIIINLQISFWKKIKFCIMLIMQIILD